MKIIKNCIFALFIFAICIGEGVASPVYVQDIFSDIDENYPYLIQLQTLYDRGMIIPDGSWKFNPDSYLNRDEFVGISMEVICERCIQPHTDYRFIESYTGEDIYFDVPETNAYFYCIAEADTQNYVRWYDIWVSCQNGRSQFWKRPFCPLNTIRLEEAIAVLLRNSWIFTIDDNNKMVSDIYAGSITQKLWNDVTPRDEAGNPYTFYGYVKKALEYEISEFDAEGNEVQLSLLEPNSQGDILPGSPVTKEDFLRMSYIILKSNNCNDIVENSLALRMHILEKSCSPWGEECESSNLEDPNNTYDFLAEVATTCEAGVAAPNGYIWRYVHVQTGEQIFRYGPYVDDYQFLSAGEWKVYLRVQDNCGNTAEVYNTIFVGEQVGIDISLDVSIDATPIFGEESLLVDFEALIDGGQGPFSYDWDFWDAGSGLWQSVDHLYLREGVYTVELMVTDALWNTWNASVIIQVIPSAERCERDADGDGLGNCDDLCPTIVGDALNSGCPIHERSCNLDCSCPSGYSCSSSDVPSCGSGVCLPDIPRESSCVYTPGKWNIFWGAVCQSCPCLNVFDFYADIRRCDLVFPAITSPNGRNVYSRGGIWQTP
jgi:hypothetical protein